MNDQPKEEEKTVVKEIHHHHYNRGVNLGSFFIGLLLITIGLIYFGKSLGIIDASFSLDPGQIWPLILVFIGLSMLSKRSWFSIFAGVVLAVVAVALVLVSSFNHNIGLKDVTTNSINITQAEGAKSYEVNIKSGAGKIDIDGGSSTLVSGTLESNFITLTTDSKLVGSNQVIDIVGQGNWNGFGRGSKNNLDLKLDTTLPTTLNLSSGAAEINLNLDTVRAEEVNIDSGASSINLAMGELVTNPKVNIKSGASSIEMSIPKNAGAQVHIDSGLTSRNFPGFTQINSKEYQTENYQSAEKKIDIDLDLGASSISIRRK